MIGCLRDRPAVAAAGRGRARGSRDARRRAAHAADVRGPALAHAATLDADAGAQLAGLVDACEFTDGPPSPVADEVAVEADDGGVRRTRFGQGAAPPGADALVTWVLDGPHVERRTGR